MQFQGETVTIQCTWFNSKKISPLQEFLTFISSIFLWMIWRCCDFLYHFWFLRCTTVEAITDINVVKHFMKKVSVNTVKSMYLLWFISICTNHHTTLAVDTRTIKEPGGRLCIYTSSLISLLGLSAYMICFRAKIYVLVWFSNQLKLNQWRATYTVS